MTVLTDFLIGWGSLNALVLVVPAALARRRGGLMRRATRNVAATGDRMRWAQRHEWQ
jgi:hypothetical protein